jgi:ABC-type glucose/galactose transport system permease subunit
MSYSINNKEYPSLPGTKKETVEQVVSRQRAQTEKKLWSKLQSWLRIFLYVILVAVICLQNDVSTAYLQNDHILKTLKTLYVVSIGDICLFFRSCLGPFVYLLPTLFELFRFLQGTYIVGKYHIKLYQVEKRVFC